MTGAPDRNLLELFADPALADFEDPSRVSGSSGRGTSGVRHGPSPATLRRVTFVVEGLLLVAALAMIGHGHFQGVLFAAVTGFGAGLLLLPEAKAQPGVVKGTG